MLALCGLEAGWLAVGVSAAKAAGGTGLELTTGSPDALCPDLSMTREAVDRRLGTLVAPQGAGWRAHYTIGHAPEGSPRDFVRLELFGPDGALQLSRDLPLEASCATMADVIALVLDRHFRGLTEHQREPALVPDEPAREEPRALTPPAVEAAGVQPRLDEPEAPAPPSSHEGAATALLGVELSVRYPLAPGAGLRWLSGIGSAFQWGLAASTPFVPERERLERGGSVELRGVSVQAFAGFATSTGPVRLFLGPAFRVTLDRGSARDLPEVDTRYRSACGAGLQAGAWGPLHGPLYWMLTGSVDWTLEGMSGDFVIDGREVLEPSPVQAWTALGIGYSL